MSSEYIVAGVAQKVWHLIIGIAAIAVGVAIIIGGAFLWYMPQCV